MKKLRLAPLALAALLGLSGLLMLDSSVYAEEGDDAPSSESSEVESSQPSPAAVPAPSISMLPTNEYVALSPNGVVDKELIITNDGQNAYNFKLYAQPYTIDDSDDNYTFSFNTKSSYTSIYEWVSFQDPSGNYTPTATYHIEPGEQKTIKYHVTSPAAIPAGGQYGAIFAETINDEAASGGINGIYTVSRVALLLYGRSQEGILVDGEITAYEVPSFLLDGPISAASRVKSLGNVDITATYKIIVRGIFGNELYANTWSYPVLPETERYVKMTWEDTPPMGIYGVQYIVSTGEQVEDRNTVVLIYPVYMIIITLLLLTAIIIWTIMILKKRKERKSRLIV